LYALYRSLRDRAMTGASVREVEEFARLPRVQIDPLLWAPALQLAAYVHGARGEWREVQKYDASIAGACKVRGCSIANEAFAVDGRGKAALAVALEQAAIIAERDQRHAEAELSQAAIDFARAAGDRDLEVDAAAHLAANAAARGEDARAQLQAEIAQLLQSGHSPFVLLRLLAEAQLAHGDATGALATAEKGLAATPGRE